MKTFSISWKSSKKPRKQRKYVYNAPKHLQVKFRSAPLSTDLLKKFGVKNIPVRKGDKVRVLRGQFKGKTGEVLGFHKIKNKVYVQGCELIKKDGTKTTYPLHASTLQIIELKTEDKKRKLKPLEKKK